MAERETNFFKNLNLKTGMRDHTDKQEVIYQGLDPKVVDRLEKAEKGELKAKLARILDRGVVQDRLVVELPDHLYGEWFRNNPMDIQRARALGFEIDTEYATKRAVHSNATGGAVVGDVIFMTCPKEVHEVIEEIRLERTVRRHSPDSKGRNREERDLVKNIEDLGSPNIKAITESSENRVNYSEIAKAVERVDSQVKPFE